MPGANSAVKAISGPYEAKIKRVEQALADFEQSCGKPSALQLTKVRKVRDEHRGALDKVGQVARESPAYQAMLNQEGVVPIGDGAAAEKVERAAREAEELRLETGLQAKRLGWGPDNREVTGEDALDLLVTYEDLLQAREAAEEAWRKAQDRAVHTALSSGGGDSVSTGEKWIQAARREVAAEMGVEEPDLQAALPDEELAKMVGTPGGHKEVDVPVQVKTEAKRLLQVAARGAAAVRRHTEAVEDRTERAPPKRAKVHADSGSPADGLSMQEMQRLAWPTLATAILSKQEVDAGGGTFDKLVESVKKNSNPMGSADKFRKALRSLAADAHKAGNESADAQEVRRKLAEANMWRGYLKLCAPYLDHFTLFAAFLQELHAAQDTGEVLPAEVQEMDSFRALREARERSGGRKAGGGANPVTQAAGPADFTRQQLATVAAQVGLPFKDGFNCLNCDGDHKLMRCPQLSAEKRQEIETALRAGA